MCRSYTANVSLPLAFATYIAASASVRSCSAVAPRSDVSAIPIEPPTTIELDPEHDRAAQLAQHPLGRRDRLVLATHPAEEDRELVAALAPDDVFGPDRAGQPLGDLDEDLVAGRVAVGVVDPLEVVEVDEQQPDQPAAPVPSRQRPLEVVAHEHTIREARQRIVEGVVDELRLEPLAIGHVDEQALRDLASALGVVRHRVGLVANPHLGAVAGEHPVLGAERLAGRPVGVVRGDRGLAVVRVDPARPELRVVDQLLGPIPEDARHLRAHVGEAAAVGDVRIGRIDIDRGRDVLDQDLEARAGLLDLARLALEDLGRGAQAGEQDDAAGDHDAEGRDRGDDHGAVLARSAAAAAQADEHEPDQDVDAAEQADDGQVVGQPERTRGPIHDRTIVLRSRIDH